jgi:hypothetical protein
MTSSYLLSSIGAAPSAVASSTRALTGAAGGVAVARRLLWAAARDGRESCLFGAMLLVAVWWDEKCVVVWCGVVWCGVVWCGVVWCGVVYVHTVHPNWRVFCTAPVTEGPPKAPIASGAGRIKFMNKRGQTARRSATEVQTAHAQ